MFLFELCQFGKDDAHVSNLFLEFCRSEDQMYFDENLNKLEFSELKKSKELLQLFQKEIDEHILINS